MDLGRVMGFGRAGLLAGVVVVTVATLGKVPTLAWGGVALAVLSIGVNTAGKVVRYSRTDIPAAHRALVIGAWSLLMACLVGLIADYTYSRFHVGYEGYFWSLAIGVAGFAMVYQGTRSKFVRDGVDDTDE